MNRLFPLAFILLAGLFNVPLCAATPTYAKPKLVREVLNGKRNVARVSWWGFDPKDSTEFLQSAINSKVKKLIIDRQKSAWVTRPLTGVSNQEIVFEKGTELIALKGAFQSKDDCLISFPQCENIIIRGEKKDCGKSEHIRMHKQDYESPAYEHSEWRHGIALYGCRNVLIQDLAIEETGGDGIYLGDFDGKHVNQNVVIRRVDCNDNYRNGISVISAENLLIEDCLLRNTSGTEPQSGIDFEPNSPDELLVNCVMRNCIAEGNAGIGYEICPQSMNSSSKPISINLVNCVSGNNREHAIDLCSAVKNPPAGLLRISHFTSTSDGMAGLAMQFNPYDAVRIEVEDSLFCDDALDDNFFPPIYIQVDSKNRPAGGISFKHVTVKDDIDRPFIKIVEPKGNMPKDMSGDITLERNGRRERIIIDKAWLLRYLAIPPISRG